MKTIGIVLALSFVMSGIAACTTTNHANNDVYFAGTQGESKYFCGPGQRHSHSCY